MWRPHKLIVGENSGSWGVLHSESGELLGVLRTKAHVARFASETDAYLVCLALNATGPK